MAHTRSSRSGTAAIITLAFALALAAVLFVVFSRPAMAAAPVTIMLWYLFAFGSGILLTASPIVTPFVHTLRKPNAGRGILEAIAYGVAAAFAFGLVGFLLSLAMRTLFAFAHVSTGAVVGIAYLATGTLAYILGLSELGLVRIVMPSPRLSPRGMKGPLAASLLSLVTCATATAPVTLVLYAHVFGVASPVYGWSLLVAHGFGLLSGLLFVSILAFARVDVVGWLDARRHDWGRVVAWSLVGVGGLLVHEGLAVAGARTTFAPFFASVFAHRYALDALFLVPLWWYYARAWRVSFGSPHAQLRELDALEREILAERRALESALRYRDGVDGERLRDIESDYHKLESRRAIVESAARHRRDGPLPRTFASSFAERSALYTLLAISAASVLVIVILATFP